jgi:hypothetical protein
MPAELTRRAKRYYWSLIELLEDLRHCKGQRRGVFQAFLCRSGLHWPVEWNEYAYHACDDPPQPPEAGFACSSCGFVREPYRAAFWPLTERFYIAWWGWRDRHCDDDALDHDNPPENWLGGRA